MDCVRALTLTAALPSLRWRAAYTYLILLARKSGRKELSFDASIDDMVDGTGLELCSAGMGRNSLMKAIRALERIQLVQISQGGREKAAYRIVKVTEDRAMNLLLALDRVRRRKLEVAFRNELEKKTPSRAFWSDVAPAFCGENGEMLKLLLSRQLQQLEFEYLPSCGPKSGPQDPSCGPKSGPQDLGVSAVQSLDRRELPQARCGPESGPQSVALRAEAVLCSSEGVALGGGPAEQSGVVSICDTEGESMGRQEKADAKKARMARNAERIRNGDMNLELSSGALGKPNTAETESFEGGIVKTERRTDQKSVSTIRVTDHPKGEELLLELQKVFDPDEIEMREDGVLLHFEEAREGWGIFEWLTKGVRSNKKAPYIVRDTQVLIDAVRGYRLYCLKLHGTEARRELKERIRILVSNTNRKAGMNRVEPKSINFVIAGALYTHALWHADPSRVSKYAKSTLHEWLNLWTRTRWQQNAAAWKTAVSAGEVPRDPIAFMESLPDDFLMESPDALKSCLKSLAAPADTGPKLSDEDYDFDL